MTYILPHIHGELGGDLLTFHLGIDCPPRGAYLNVDGKFVSEENEKAIVFDGPREHFALAMSKQERVVLYMEFDRSRM